MTDQSYMSGRGLRKRTRQLNDAAWDAVEPAFVWACLATFCAVPTVFFWIQGPIWVALLATVPTIGALYGAALYWLRWERAISAVKAHSRMMREETGKRGQGWARD